MASFQRADAQDYGDRRRESRALLPNSPAPRQPVANRAAPGHDGSIQPAERIQRGTDMLLRRLIVFAAVVPVVMSLTSPVNARDELRESLWAAVRNGDDKAVQAALDKGADVNAKNEIGVTALWIAC